MWRTRTEQEPAAISVARAATDGASLEDLIRQALKILAQEGSADRVGVWLETASGSTEGFRGAAWEPRDEGAPVEWSRLSFEPPFPQELLVRNHAVEQDEQQLARQAIVEPLVGMSHALWIPVETEGHLYGVVLAASRKRQGELPQALCEQVAAELALTLKLREEQRVAAERQEDLAFLRRILSLISSGEDAQVVLQAIVENCTAAAAHGPSATFAVIGEGLPDGGSTAGSVVFAWKSGAGAWVRAVESEPLASIWRTAVTSRSVAGGEPHVSWGKNEVARVIAVPLEANKQTLGVLVAGIPPQMASLAVLERLELRAMLAAWELARKAAAEEESRRTAWQRALLEHGSEAAAVIDASGTIASLNPAFCELLGRKAQRNGESANNPDDGAANGLFSELFRARDQERIEAWRRRMLSSECASAEWRLEPIDAVLCNGTPVRLRTAIPAGGETVAILVESLQERDAAAIPQRAEAELRGVIEWLEQGVVLFDTANRVRTVNTRFAQIAGLGLEEAQPVDLDELIGSVAGQAADPERFAERWRRLAHGGEDGIREEFQLVRPVPRILERSSRPLLDNAGKPLGRVEIYRDLTSQRVFQSKLLQTEKLAALGQMVTGVAHELSNPVTSVLGYAQRLLLRDDEAGRSEEARRIFQEAERAAAILRQLLLTARESPPERRLVSLNQLVLRTMELQRLGLAAERVKVDLNLDPALPHVQGDAGQLQQVLMNLIGNARQAVEQRDEGKTIRVRTYRENGSWVRLEVGDNGPGVPDAIRARIFDPFFTTKPPGVGTGLGLAIVLSIAREHGGHVSVANAGDGGAVFTVELPSAGAALPGALEKEYGVTQSRARSGRKPEPAPVRVLQRASESPRVLVVEDEPTVARLIVDVLEDEHCRVEMMLDGREALKRAMREDYDLVICDMKMPGMDGQHFYKALARDGNPVHRNFLFVTGDVAGTNTQEFLARNELPFVAKPFRLEELTQKVRSVLGRRTSVRVSLAESDQRNTAKSGAV